MPQGLVILQNILDHLKEATVCRPQVEVINLVLVLPECPQCDKLAELGAELVLEGDDEKVDTLDLVVLQFVLLTRTLHASVPRDRSSSSKSSCIPASCTSSSWLVGLDYSEE